MTSRHMAPKSQIMMPMCMRLNISETVPDKGSVSMDHNTTVGVMVMVTIWMMSRGIIIGISDCTAVFMTSCSPQKHLMLNVLETLAANVHIAYIDLLYSH